MIKLLWAYLYCSILFSRLGEVNGESSSSTTINDNTKDNSPATTESDSSSDETTLKSTIVEQISSQSTLLTTIDTTESDPSFTEESKTTFTSISDQETSISATVSTASATTETDLSSSGSTEPNSEETSSPTSVSTNQPATTPHHKKIQASYTWKSKDMVENPIIVTVEQGYFISVTVSDVTMSDGNYLLIKREDSDSQESTDGRIFANFVVGPLKYLFKTNKVFAFCENTATDDDNENIANFTVVFEQVGDGPTTVEEVSTTTEVSVPPTKPKDSVYISVNVSGKPLADYGVKETRDAFRECVAIMGNSYCEINNIQLKQNITKEYVLIAEITRCPLNWPDSYECVTIKFRLPIFYEGGPSDEYKLNTDDLRKMWLRRDEIGGECLYENGFDAYEEPDIEGSIIWWAVGISLLILAFIAVLWFLKTFNSRIRAVIRRDRSSNSDTESIIPRDSVGSLGPHYLQDMPKMFEN